MLVGLKFESMKERCNGREALSWISRHDMLGGSACIGSALDVRGWGKEIVLTRS